MPDDSPTNTLGTDALSWVAPNQANILSISFLLGFGDGIFQNQISSLIGLLYPSERDAAARNEGEMIGGVKGLPTGIKGCLFHRTKKTTKSRIKRQKAARFGCPQFFCSIVGRAVSE